MADSKKYGVNEIFYSLQGEGFHTGTPAVFVRLSGCNLRCPFCDTDFSASRPMTADEVAAEVTRYPSRHVILTGGEPLLQADEALLRALHAAGRSVHVETNGTLPLPDGAQRFDWVTCSPKEGSEPVLGSEDIDELKVVLTDTVDPERWASRFHTARLFLQPCSCRNTSAVVDYIKKHPNWRLSLQTHKYIDIP